MVETRIEPGSFPRCGLMYALNTFFAYINYLLISKLVNEYFLRYRRTTGGALG
jgi:hypothetical protein